MFKRFSRQQGMAVTLGIALLAGLLLGSRLVGPGRAPVVSKQAAMQRREGPAEPGSVGAGEITSRQPRRCAPQPVRTSAQVTARTINYTYDGAGRLVQVDYGNGKRITYTYDKAGNLLRREVVGGP